MFLNNGHGAGSGNTSANMDNSAGTSMMDDTSNFQQQQQYQQQWNSGQTGPVSNTLSYPGDRTGFPFPGLMNMGIRMNGGSAAMCGGSPMGMMMPGADQSYYVSNGSESTSAPVTPFNQPRSLQQSTHQQNQQQQQQMAPASSMDDTKPVAEPSPERLLQLSRKRAEVFASLKQRAKPASSSSRVQAGNRNSRATESPTAVGKESPAPTPTSANNADTERPAASASKRPPLVKANTTTGQEASSTHTNMAAKNEMNMGNKHRVQTPQPEGRKPLGQRTADVDRLLAECKAAAESGTKNGNGKPPTGTSTLRRANTDVSDPRSRGFNTDNNDDDKESFEEGEYNSEYTGNEDFFAGKEKQGEPAKARDHHSKDGETASTVSGHGTRPDKRPNQSGPAPERRLYEPPKRTSTVDDSVPPVRHGPSLTWRKHDDRKTAKTNHAQTRAPAPFPQKPEIEHDFMHLSQNDVEEIKEWLVITGFHDEEYRRKLVTRRRKLAALQADMAELMREEQEERDFMINRVEAPRSSFPPVTLQPQLPVERVQQVASLTFKYNKNKPSTQATSANAVPVVPKVRTEGHGPAATNVNGESNHREVEHPTEYLKSPAIGQKRSVPSDEGEFGGRPKMARTNTNTDDHAGGNGDNDTEMVDENSGVAITNQNMHRDRELLLQKAETEVGPRGRGAYMDIEGDTTPSYPDYKYHSQSPYRGRGRGRGRGGRGSGYATRAGMRGGGAPHFNPPRTHHSAASVNNGRLTHENTRFFLIKSLSHGYVEDSQQDGTWATQLKNVDKLIEAYNGTENVIFFFSVNQSKAFQGYARMESLPDENKVPRPEWASRLSWECSAPFRIEWLNSAETRFSWVAHLKNAYHDDSNVFFGRDGQEIDPYSGAELCVLLDEHGSKAMK